MLNNRLAQLLLGALLSIALVGLLPSLILWLDLNAFEKQQLGHILMPRLSLMVTLAALGLIVPILFFGRFYYRHLHSLGRVNQRLLEAVEAEGQALELDDELSPEEHTLLSNTNTLMRTVQQRRVALDSEMAHSGSTRRREKSRLSSLLNQLSQGVIICNIEGSILLANGRARSLLGKGQAGDALGESIFSLLDAELIAHALTIVRERLDSGNRTPSTTLSAITRSGNMVRLQLAVAVSDDCSTAEDIDGFVLTLEDIESQHTQSRERDKLLHGLSRETRNLLTRLRTGLDSLQRDPSAPQHQRSLLAALARDTVRHCEHLERLSFQRADQLAHVWPLEPMLAGDLCSSIEQQLWRAHQLRFPFESKPPTGLWLAADSFSMAQGVANCISALQTDWDLDGISLATDSNSEHQLLLIYIAWSTGELRQEDFRALATSTRQRVAVSGRAFVELIERHGGRAWLEEQTEKEGQRLCLALPSCESPAGASLRLPDSEFDFSEAADKSAVPADEPHLRKQYVTVIAVGAERNSAAEMARGESTLAALLLAGGKAQALAQKQLHNATLVQKDPHQDSDSLGEFSRKGIFVTHDAKLLLGQLGTADRQLIAQAGLLDTADIARLLFPAEASYSLFHVASRLGLQPEVDSISDQVKLIASVFNRSLTRLQTRGIHSQAQLHKELNNIGEKLS